MQYAITEWLISHFTGMIIFLLTTRRLGTVTTEKIYQCFPQLLIFHENNDPDG